MTVIASALLMTVFTEALTPPAPRTTIRESGREIFQQYCSNCHGDDGKANTPRGRRKGAKDLTKSKVSVRMAIKIITYGRGEMPAFRKRLSNSDIRSVNAYIRSLRK